jgi:Flp pilus assembly protein TadG
MRHGRTRRGQALVEFALILPILMILLMGIIEFGRAWNVKQVLTDASREGARLAVVAGDAATRTQTQVETRIRTVLAHAGVDSTAVAITWTNFEAEPGEITTVELSMPYSFFVLHRLVALFTPDGTITLRTATRMRIE